MSDEERLKITLDDLDDFEHPAQPESPAGARAQVEQLGRRMSETAKSTAHKTGDALAGKAAEVTTRGAEAVRDKVSGTIEAQAKATADAVEARLREVDWKAEVQKGATDGLKWLGARLALLAERITPDPLPGESSNQKDKPSG